MERMWAPWRKEYIESAPKGGCIFCDHVNAADDSKNRVVKRGKASFCVLNRYPYNSGHVMVAPCRHVPSLKDLKPDELAGLFGMVSDMVELLKKKIKPDGFNIGINLGRAAGAGVEDHVHVHIVPRWSGDTNFMPVTADIKVIPQSLDDMQRLLSG